MMQMGASCCFSPMTLACYSRTATNRSASIYRSEVSAHSIEELYDVGQRDELNEYVARVGIGKALTQSVRGGTADAQRAIKAFGYTRRNARQLRRLRIVNGLPRLLRPMVDGLYSAAAWIFKKRGL
jgi:hypothetical protein